jgi:hypothetical protein
MKPACAVVCFSVLLAGALSARPVPHDPHLEVASIEVGSKAQKVSVITDAGSHHFAHRTKGTSQTSQCPKATKKDPGLVESILAALSKCLSPGTVQKSSKSAVVDFTESGFLDLNTALYAGTPNEEQCTRAWAILEELKAFDPAGANTVVWRGTNGPYMGSKTAGDEVMWKGFASTSLSKDVSCQRARRKFMSAGEPHELYQITLKSGQGRNVESVSSNAHEREVLLPPGSAFKITSKSECDPSVCAGEVQVICYVLEEVDGQFWVDLNA